MNLEPPEDGLHRDYHSNGNLRSEFTIKNGRHDGISREWHENGQLAEERPFRKGFLHGICRFWNNKGELLGTSNFKNGTGIDRLWLENGPRYECSFVRGQLCGRMRAWAPDGMLMVERYFFNNRPISKKLYCEKCQSDSGLPRFEDKKPANNFGNYLRHLRRERKEQAKLGPTSEQLRHRKWFDGQRKAETKLKTSSEAMRWLVTKAKSERELGEMTRLEAVRLVRKLYSAGAVGVWAVSIERDSDGAEYSNRLVIALPKVKINRSRIYDLCVDPARPSMSRDDTPAIYSGESFMTVSLL